MTSDIATGNQQVGGLNIALLGRDERWTGSGL